MKVKRGGGQRGRVRERRKAAECAAAAAELARLRFPPHTVEAFLDGWSKAVDPVQGVDGAEDVGGRVWAADFNAALQARRVARDAEVAERRARMESGEAEADALREAMAAEEQMKEEMVEKAVVVITPLHRSIKEHRNFKQLFAVFSLV